VKHKSLVFISVILLSLSDSVSSRAAGMVGVNVVLNTGITNTVLGQLGAHGKIRDVVYELEAVTMQIRDSDLPAIRALPYVAAANPDSARKGAPVSTVDASNFAGGMNTWNLDAINVTDFERGRILPYNGTGVYIAVIDSGLPDSWREYFPQERIAAQYGIAFGGGGGEAGSVSSQPNKWEHDQNSHGVHVTSTIIGYNRLGTFVDGVAPMATVIPVKVLNQNGSAWSSVVARGITYVADLKAGPLADHPVVINLSLGGPTLDAMEKAAIDYAIGKGVIVIAAAGNEGEDGMAYPAAYPPVISVGASGWTKEWTFPFWWYAADVLEPSDTAPFYITGFSSRQKAGQQLDIAAPGSWIMGPYQFSSGHLSFYFLTGTSMAASHVAGVAALMLQKNKGLTQSEIENTLKKAAIPLSPGCAYVTAPTGVTNPLCWGADATGAGLLNAEAALAMLP
jgi:subtilisin family serine protease